MFKYLFVVPSALLLNLGCETATENQKNANQAQSEANHKIAEVKAEAHEETVKAQAKADKGIAEANADYQTLRENFRHDVNNRLVSLNETIAKSEARLATETGDTKAKLVAQLPAVRARRDEFSKNFEALKDVTASNWDAAKASLDKQWTDLKSFTDRSIN